MNGRKIVNFVLVAILTVVNFLTVFAAPRQVDAAPSDGQVTVNLHKLVFKPGQLPSGIQNDGTTATANLLQNGVPLADVTYQVYNVTERYAELRQEGPELTSEELYDMLKPTGRLSSWKRSDNK